MWSRSAEFKSVEASSLQRRYSVLPNSCMFSLWCGMLDFGRHVETVSINRSAENKNAKEQQFAMTFSRFWIVRIMIFLYFGGPGDLILEARGLILRISGVVVPISRILEIVVISGALPVRKGSPFLRSKRNH